MKRSTAGLLLAAVVTFASPAIEAQLAPSQPVKLRPTGTELPSLSTQIPFGKPVCSAAKPGNQPPISTRWHFLKAADSPTPWVRAHLSVADHDNGQWKIQVYDGSRELRETLSSDDFPDGQLWTVEIPGSLFSVDLVADRRVSVQACIDMISVKSSQAVLSGKALTAPDGKDRRVLVTTGVTGYSFRNPVAIIWFLKKDGTKTNCSGFAITATDVMTNYHCISAKSQLRNTEVWFSYEQGQQYTVRKVKSFAVMPNQNLDYSILTIDNPIPDSFVASVSTRDLLPGINLILMQHPDGSKKLTAADGCVVKAMSAPDTVLPDSDFSHLCDASGGSSGAPIMDLNGVVVGLHHMEQYDDDTKTYYNMAVKIKTLFNEITKTEDGNKLVGALKVVP
jgi:V8-like Glu-specific endopeptidase